MKYRYSYKNRSRSFLFFLFLFILSGCTRQGVQKEDIKTPSQKNPTAQDKKPTENSTNHSKAFTLTPGTHELSLTISDSLRKYILYVPKNFSKDKTTSLLIMLHGGGSSSTKDMALTKFNAVSDKNNFLVVYPSGKNNHWNDGRKQTKIDTGNIDDVTFITTIISDITNKLNSPSDPSKLLVYLAGFSNGGHMVNRLLCEKPSLFSGAAVVSATLSKELSTTCSPSKKIPYILFHGTKDPVSPYNGGPMSHDRGSVLSAQETIRFFGTEPVAKLISLPDAGHTWPGGPQYLPKAIIGTVDNTHNASKEIWEFFQSQ